MAAAYQEKKLLSRWQALIYQVQDLCFFLKKLGVKIEGIGTTTLKIRGIKEARKNITFYPTEDPIESMTFIAAAVATNSKITVKRVPIEFVELELFKLKKMGLEFDISTRYRADKGKVSWLT